MPLSAESMKNDIIAAMKGSTNAQDANKKCGDAILKNICDNIKITYGWAAVNPAGSPDPVTSFEATVSGGGTLTPSDSFDAMVLKLAALIKGLKIEPPTGFNLAPLIFNPAGVLSISMDGEDNQDSAMTTLSDQLVKSIKASFINPTPSTGSKGAFTGATAGMIIE